MCVPMLVSTHVETVVLLSHKSSDSHIDVKVEFGEGKGKMSLDAIAKQINQRHKKVYDTYLPLANDICRREVSEKAYRDM